MTATLLKPPRTASVTLEIPEPTPTGRSRPETEFEIKLYHGLGLQDGDEDVTDFDGVVRLAQKYGTHNVELIAREFHRDIEGDPTDIRTCHWMESEEKWSQWK